MLNHSNSVLPSARRDRVPDMSEEASADDKSNLGHLVACNCGGCDCLEWLTLTDVEAGGAVVLWFYPTVSTPVTSGRVVQTCM